MEEQKDKPFLKGIRSKVIAAFLLACVAILLALSITYYSFEGLLVTVDDLTTPNDKLRTLNNLFQQITELDQQQRADAIRNPKKSYAEFLKESKALIHTIDTLRAMTWENDQQMDRLHAMEEILHRRDKLFLSYLKLKSEFIYNKKFSNRLDSLSKIIASSYQGDTTITTTQKRTTTTTYHPTEEEDQSFFNRLFSKKKSSESPDTRIEVQEELSVKVDTVAIAGQDSAIAEVGRIMKSLEQDQRLQNQQMLRRELELIATNTVLISQLLNTLRDVEKEERATQEANTEKAASLVNTSIKRIGGIMLVFFLGAALLVFLILIDITRSNQLRKQLVKAKEEAERLSQVKQRFLANMSHEIRTPLQSIIGFAEQLKEKKSADPQALEAIHNSSEHLLHIVNEVLDYSRIDSGKLTLEREPFYLDKVINEVEASMRILADRKNLSFVTESNIVAYDIPLIGDPFRLRQILYNLVTNAIKFTENGQVKLLVETDDTGYTVRCRFKVIDTGIGMSQEDIDRVFQLFEQVHRQNHHGGAGLGLTIVKKLVEAQYGTLHVKSEPGNGSVFTIELCYDKAPVEKKEIQHKTTAALAKFTGKVWVVDDDPLILRLCSIILQKHHVDHVIFNDPEKVLTEKTDKAVQFIFLDIRMPNVSGVDLCRKLREQMEPDTKIVALTAHVLPQEKTNLLDQGFDHILSKPFRESELIQLLGIETTPHPGEKANAEFSLSILQQMTMGDEALLHTVLIQFIEDTENDMQQIRSQLATHKYDGLRENVHRLAGRTGQIGAHTESEQFKWIEDRLAARVAPHEIEGSINSALEACEALVKKLKETLEVKAI